MNTLFIIFHREMIDSLRNKWIIAITLLLAVLALSLGFMGNAPTGSQIQVNPLTLTVVSLSSLSIFLIPLIAMLLSYDTIVGEIERGTMALLLSYPVTRSQILLGKFLGHLGTLSIATILGYGLAGLALQWAHNSFSAEAWLPFSQLIAASILLGASFLTMGYAISTFVRERATAAGLAIGIWLFFVVIFDLLLLSVLVADQGQLIQPSTLNHLLLLNPTDVYRLLNLTGYETISVHAGIFGNSHISSELLWIVQIIWIVIPFILAAFLFSRKQL